MNPKAMTAAAPPLLLLAAATTAAAYLQVAQPVRVNRPLTRPKWDTFELAEPEQVHEITQPPLSEKTLWERALERQEWATASPASPQDKAASPEQEEPPASWQRLAALAASGDIIEGEVISVNGGGAVCRVHGRPAFLPRSHLGERTARVGRTLSLKVLRADAASRRLVVSHREATRATLRRGDIVRGVVHSLRPYGAFVSFGGGLRGLLHKHSISAHDWKLVRAAAGDDDDDAAHEDGYVVDACFRNAWETDTTLLAVGSPVACLVTGHNRDNGRISLSTRALEPAPGDMLRDPTGVFRRAETVAAAHRDRRARELLEYEILASLCEENSLSSLLNDLLP